MEFYNVWRTVFKWNKVHLTILALATEEFKKISKNENAMFSKMHKKSTLSRISFFWRFSNQVD